MANANRIELRQGGGYFGPEVRILVDGQEVFAIDDHVGQDPAEILDTGALVPSVPPRRVAVYMCSCGCAGCSDLAPLVQRVGNRVEWVSARQFTGAFDGALPEDGWEFEPDDGEAVDIPDFSFDADEYLAEVERARSDRGWEPPARLVSRRAADLLRSGAARLSERGYSLDRVWTTSDPSKTGVALRSMRGQKVVDVTTAGTVEQRARQIADVILLGEEEQWAISFSNY